MNLGDGAAPAGTGASVNRTENHSHSEYDRRCRERSTSALDVLSALGGDPLAADLTRWQQVPCPAHDDDRPSAGVRMSGAGRLVVSCFVGCSRDDILRAVGVEPAALGSSVPARRGSTASWAPPVDTTEPVDEETTAGMLGYFLRKRRWAPSVAERVGLTVVRYPGHYSPRELALRVRFPYHRGGELVYWADRAVLDDARRWMKPSTSVSVPFLADRLAIARATGHVYLSEGESDAVAVLHALPDAAVLGIPGSCGFKAEWAERFRGLVVWVLADADAGGRRMRRRMHEHLDPVATAVHDVLVPAPYVDVDAWRRASRVEFRDQLQTAIVRAAT